MSTDRGMDKDDVVYKYHGILLSHTKKKWNNTICNNMNRPRDYHIKSDRERQVLKKKKKEKQVLYDRGAYMWNLKKL